MARTSDEVSRKAAQLMRVTTAELMDLTLDEAKEMASDIRSVAASALRQDEVKGWRKWFG